MLGDCLVVSERSQASAWTVKGIAFTVAVAMFVVSLHPATDSPSRSV